jgi:hypothetical protein
MVVYRITPHQSLTNNTNRKMWRLLHKMYEIYNHASSRISREGFKITFREKDQIWFDIVFKNVDGQNKIEFYMSTTETWAKKFKQTLESKMKVSVEEATIDDLKIPEQNTLIHELRYVRHDIFSQKTDATEQTTPISTVLSTIEDIEENDMARLSFCNEVISRKKWSQIADYAHEKLQKGKVPKRARITIGSAVNVSKNIIGSIMNEINDVIQDTLRAFENVFFRSDKKDDNKEKLIKKKSLIEEIEKGRISTRTYEKQFQPVWKSHVRVASHSDSKLRREMIANTLSTSLSEVGEDNELKGIRIRIGSRKADRIIKEINTLHLSSQTKNDPDVNIVSSDELGKMVQLPTRDVQHRYQEALSINKRIETELPKVFLDESGILVGHANDSKGDPHAVHIPTQDKDFLFTPRGINGSPRMGKDQHVINMVVEAKRKHNIGAVIPDVVNERNGHRGMGDAIRDHLPADDVIDLDLGDTSNPIYLGLESIVKNIPDVRIASDRIAEEITEFLMSDGDGDRFQTEDYLREASKAVMGDPLGIKLMFMSEYFRNKVIEEKQDTFDMDIWKDYDKMSEGKQGQLYAPVMRRLGQIMNSEFLKPIFCQKPNPAMDLYKWIDEGKVVILRIPTGQISERQVEILVYWIVLNVFLIKIAQGGQSKAAGTYLVLNEPHQFLSDGLVHFMERMLSEGPKYRLAPIIVFHHFSQFKKYPGFVDMMLAASMNWHIFKNTNIETYKKLMPYLSNTFDAPEQAFETTKRFQYISVWLNSMGEYERPFITDALPMIGDRYESVDNSFLTKRHSRQFGKPIKEVLVEIKERNKLTFQKASPD